MQPTPRRPKPDSSAPPAPASQAEFNGGQTQDLVPPGQTSPPVPAGQVTAPPQQTQFEGHAQSPPPAGRAPAKTQPLTQLGEYRLVKKLGAGGMGAVYQGVQIGLERPVAIKVMAKHLSANPDLVQRFLREARVLARLDHPHIVRSFGVGEEKGFHYLAMEYVDGGSMQAHLERLGKLSIGDALHVILACARALQHAHEQNIIHRDIKPDNVLLTRAGVVKLADLGLAKALEEDLSLTKSGVGAGTPFYMAPEQAVNAKHVDVRTDIYSLGCMLYAFLVGEVPFKGNTSLEIIKAKEVGRFPPARRNNPEVTERLDLMIGKMLAARPEVRYQTCADVIHDLEGLGLANAELSFVPSTGAPRPRPAAAATPTIAPAESEVARPAPRPRPKQETADDSWYVRYTKPDGEVVTRKVSTSQLNKLIRDPRFDRDARASRQPDQDFRPLTQIREFEEAIAERSDGKEEQEKSSLLGRLFGRWA